MFSFKHDLKVVLYKKIFIIKKSIIIPVSYPLQNKVLSNK